MPITSIILQHTNPSLGPHETITTVRLAVNNQHLDAVNTFLEKSVVNGVAKMKDYLDAIHQNQTTLIEKVEKNRNTGDKPCGGTISHLTFHFAEQASITLHDVYRDYSVTEFYPTFTKYMMEHGTISKHQPFDLGSPSYLDTKADILPPSNAKKNNNPIKPIED